MQMTMKAEDFQVSPKSENSSHRQCGEGVKTDIRGSSTDVNRQCEELSSTDAGFQETEETSEPQAHCNGLYGIHSLLEGYPKIVEISDEELKRITHDSLPEGHLDNPGPDGSSIADVIREIESKRCINSSNDT